MSTTNKVTATRLPDGVLDLKCDCGGHGTYTQCTPVNVSIPSKPTGGGGKLVDPFGSRVLEVFVKGPAASTTARILCDPSDDASEPTDPVLASLTRPVQDALQHGLTACDVSWTFGPSVPISRLADMIKAQYGSHVTFHIVGFPFGKDTL